MPLASEDLEPLCTFDPKSQASIHGALLQLDAWLTPLRAHFELGSEIVELGAVLRHGIFHLSLQDRLLAVLDFREGKGSLSPHLHPADLRKAKWDKRPGGAGAAPPGFISISPAQLTWIYVHRSERDLLPARIAKRCCTFATRRACRCGSCAIPS